jgi:hypothetical protein
MADVQTTSVAAIRASAMSPAASPRAAGVSAVVESAAGVAPEVMFEHANVAMLNSLSAKSVLAGEKLVATYSIST